MTKILRIILVIVIVVGQDVTIVVKNVWDCNISLMAIIPSLTMVSDVVLLIEVVEMCAIYKYGNDDVLCVNAFSSLFPIRCLLFPFDLTMNHMVAHGF